MVFLNLAANVSCDNEDENIEGFCRLDQVKVM